MHTSRSGKGRALLKFIIGLLIVFIICAGLYLFVQEYDRTPADDPASTAAPIATPLAEPTAAAEPEPEVTPEPVPEVTPEPQPEETPVPTQTPAEESTDAPVPAEEPTPAPETEQTPPEVTEPEPEVTPEPAPEVTPEPEPAVENAPEPESVPEPGPEVTPEPEPEVETAPEPEPEPETEPETQPEPEKPVSHRMEGMSVPAGTQDATFGMLEFKPGGNALALSAYLSAADISSETAQYYLVVTLANGRAAYVYDTWPVENNTGLETDLACFAGTIAASDLPDGWYRLGLMAVDGDKNCYVSIGDDSYSFVVSAGRIIRYAE